MKAVQSYFNDGSQAGMPRTLGLSKNQFCITEDKAHEIIFSRKSLACITVSESKTPEVTHTWSER